MHLIVPVAGEGRRFKAAGHTDLKPLIQVSGRTMLDWALDPIPVEWEVLVVCQRLQQGPLLAALPFGSKNLDLITLPGPTQGAACTVLAAALGLPPEEPCAVMNADQTFAVDWNMRMRDGKRKKGLHALHEWAIAKGWDGFILTFKGEGDKWSYVREQDGWVAEVAEKRPISDQATVGFYWFRRAQDLVDACCLLIAQNHRTKGEFYLAPCYNELVERYSARIKAVPVAEFWGLGDPESVEIFRRKIADEPAHV